MRLSASVILLNQAKLLVRGRGKVSGRDEGSAQEKEIRLHSRAELLLEKLLIESTIKSLLKTQNKLLVAFLHLKKTPNSSIISNV